jgi:hypothetical protein
MTRNSISIFLLVVGLVWAAVVSGFVALLAGFFGNAPPWNPAAVGKLLVWFSWVLVGPLLLIAGAILVLTSTHKKVGSVLSLAGCGILTVMMGYQALSMLHDLGDPLIAKPPYGEYVIALILALLAYAGAVQLYRLAYPAAAQEE